MYEKAVYFYEKSTKVLGVLMAVGMAGVFAFDAPLNVAGPFFATSGILCVVYLMIGLALLGETID